MFKKQIHWCQNTERKGDRARERHWSRCSLGNVIHTASGQSVRSHCDVGQGGTQIVSKGQKSKLQL